MVIEIIIGLAGIAIAYASLKQAQKPHQILLPEPTEEMDNLKAHFLMNQQLSIEIQEILKSFITEKNAADKIFYDDMTFSKYLDFVKSTHEESLSEKIYKNLDEPIYSRSNIMSMLSSLQTQNTNLLIVKNMLQNLN